MEYNERIDIKKIKAYMAENNLTANKFCKVCGIGYSTYKKMMHNRNTYRCSALFKIAKVMNMYAHDLINKEFFEK